MQLDGIIFDKDGTLFDFGATWNTWAIDLISELSQGDIPTARHLAEVTHFDLSTGTFLPTSPIIAGTAREAAESVAVALPDRTVSEIEDLMNERAAEVPQVPPTNLRPLLDDLRGRGLRLGVMTNDSEFAARRHLDTADVSDLFHWVAGYDSGFGAKPAPDPLLAFAQRLGLDPACVAMVGDSTHDLVAGRAAGMTTIGVLTGLAGRRDLEMHADVILPHVGHLPDWLDALRSLNRA